MMFLIFWVFFGMKESIAKMRFAALTPKEGNGILTTVNETAVNETDVSGLERGG